MLTLSRDHLRPRSLEIIFYVRLRGVPYDAFVLFMVAFVDNEKASPSRADGKRTISAASPRAKKKVRAI